MRIRRYSACRSTITPLKSQMQKKFSRRFFIFASAAVSTIVLTGCSEKSTTNFSGSDLSDANFARDFRLRDPDGNERTLADFRGKVVMVFFGFTQCPDVCPTALARAAQVKKLLGSDADSLQVLFISVDPERDTPEILRAYTAAFDPTFLALYGDQMQLAKTAKEFKVIYKKVPTGSSYTIDHTSTTLVYDPKGRLRVKLSHTQSAIDYAADVRRLLNGA